MKGLKNGSSNLLHLFVFLFALFSSLMVITSVSVMGSQGKEANATGSEVALEFPDAPVIINDSTIGSALQRYSPFVLDFWETGCRPCQLIDPKIDKTAVDLKGKVVFGKLNINQNSKSTVKFKVFNYPTLLIFKNGSLIYRQIGNIPEGALESMILGKLGIK
jgi:thioredoxin 1